MKFTLEIEPLDGNEAVLDLADVAGQLFALVPELERAARLPGPLHSAGIIRDDEDEEIGTWTFKS